MFFFWYKYKVNIVFILLVVISLSMLTFSQISHFKNCKALLIYLFSPSQNIATKIIRDASGFWANISDLTKSQEENVLLHATIRDLKSRNNQLQEEALENNRLKKLLALKESLLYSTIAARVIAQAPGDMFTTVLIDKGDKDGIAVNMPVVTYNDDNQGVVGKVSEVMDDTSVVLLLTNPVCKISVLITRTRFDGLLEGRAQVNQCRLNYLSLDADVKAGDTVVTSGKGSLFPKGLIIGKVTEVSITEGKLYKSARVSPVIDLTRLEEVLVIKRRLR